MSMTLANKTEPRDIVVQHTHGFSDSMCVRFAKLVSCFNADVTVEKNGYAVSGIDIMQLMTLEAAHGTTLRLSATGPQAQDALDALQGLAECSSRLCIIMSWEPHLLQPNMRIQGPRSDTQMLGPRWLDALAHLHTLADTGIEPYLRQVGHSLYPAETKLPLPFPFNGTCQEFAHNFSFYYEENILVIGQPAAEAFAKKFHLDLSYSAMLERQGLRAESFECATIVYVFTVPSPDESLQNGHNEHYLHYDRAFAELSKRMNTGRSS